MYAVIYAASVSLSVLESLHNVYYLARKIVTGNLDSM